MATAKKDITKVLSEEHRKVEELFKKLESAKTPAAKERFFERIREELELHADAEEAVLYPVSMNLRATTDLVDESVEEHDEVRTLLKRLSKMSAEDEGFEAAVQELKQNVEHHVGEEEGEMFPRLREIFTPDLLEGLASDYRKAQRKLK